MNEKVPIEVSALAVAQVRAAEIWWRDNRPKAPGAIRAELERASSLIALRKLGAAKGGKARAKNLSKARRLDKDLRGRPAAEKAVQPCEVPRLQVGGCHRTARPETHFHVLRGAPESHDADVDAALHAHAAAVALYFMYYNFGRIHQTLRVTPAMEAGIANHVWSVEEIVNLLSESKA